MSKASRRIIIVVLCLLLILFLPFFASTFVGKRLFIYFAEKKIDAKIEISSLQLSWLGPQKINHMHCEADEFVTTFDRFSLKQPLWRAIGLLDGNWKSFTGAFTLQNASVYVNHPDYPIIKLSELNAKAQKKDKKWQIDTHAQIASPDGKQGFLSLKGFSTLDPWEKIDCSIDFSFSHFPTYFLRSIKNGKLLTALTGDLADGKLTLDLQKGKGNLFCDLDASNLQTTINGTIQKGILYLQKDLWARFHLTQSLSDHLLKKINPFFITALSASHPIELYIHKEGFSTPMDFSIKKSNVDKATLTMGQILCENGKTLDLVISLLKSRRLSGQKQMTVWFTPLDFSLQKGKVHCKRMDMLLADSLHLCTWGDINLQSNKLSMHLGLTKGALQRSFNIKNLPAGYVLSIPLKGTISNPSIDLAQGAAKIGYLFAKKKTGPVFSRILPDKTQHIPPPTYPIPWEGKVPQKNRPSWEGFLQTNKKNF